MFTRQTGWRQAQVDQNMRITPMNRAYIFQTWIGTVIGGPLLLAIYMTLFVSGHAVLDGWQLFPMALFSGLFLSLPSLVVYLLVFELTRNRVRRTLHLQILLALISLLLILISFWILGGYLAVWFAVAYAVASIIAAFLFGRQRTF